MVAAAKRTDFMAYGILAAFYNLEFVDVVTLRQIRFGLSFLMMLLAERYPLTDSLHNFLA